MSSAAGMSKWSWALLAGIPAAAVLTFAGFALRSRPAAVGGPGPRVAARGVVDGPRVQSFTVVPGGNGVPAAIIVTFDKAVQPETVNVNTFRVVRAGGDGIFDNGNDVAIQPVSVSLTAPDTAKLDLTGVKLPDDQYRVTLVGTASPLPPPPPPPPPSSSSGSSSSSSSSTSSSGSSSSNSSSGVSSSGSSSGSGGIGGGPGGPTSNGGGGDTSGD